MPESQGMRVRDLARRDAGVLLGGLLGIAATVVKGETDDARFIKVVPGVRRRTSIM